MKAKDIIMPALFAALAAVLALVTIPLPFSPVPVTGQTLALMLAGVLLSPRHATLSMTIYILLGAAGAPVFAGGTGGLTALLGPAGGYLAGFIPGAAIIAFLRGNNRLPRLAAAVFCGGMLAVYIPGTLWLSHVTGMGLVSAFTVGTLPYVPGDLAKLLVATSCGVRLRHLSE